MPPKRKVIYRKTVENSGGIRNDLPTTALPTHGDIARYIYIVKDAKQEIPTQIQIVEKQLVSVCQQCNTALPPMEKLALRIKLVRFLEKVRDFYRRQMKLAAKKLLMAVIDISFLISLPALASSRFCHAVQVSKL
jgi:hypothetical protein